MSDENKDLSPEKREEDPEEELNQESEEDQSMEAEADQKKEVKAVAGKKKDDSEEESGDEEEQGEEQGEEKEGIYDKPLVLEVGRKRERKKVERLTFQTQTPEEKKFEVADGKGEKLGDMPFVEFKLSRHKAEELKPLHRILFRGRGVSHLDVKKHIRQFSGFPFSKDDEEYDKREQLLKSKGFTMPMIKQVCEVLDVARGGTKEELVDRLLEFLMKPQDSGRKVPKPKRKRKSKGGGEKEKGKKSKKKEKKAQKVKSQKKVESDEEEDEEEEEEAEEEESEEEEEEESEEEVTPPPKKRKRAEPKKKAEKKKKEKKTPEKKKPAPKKASEKKQKKKKVESEVDDDLSSSSDDDAPLVKQKREGPPSNDELKDVIKKLLDKANLEEVTMKTILKDVYAKYPKYDLADRKEFIKGTVKQIIS